jgi:hypothetical protein
MHISRHLTRGLIAAAALLAINAQAFGANGMQIDPDVMLDTMSAARQQAASRAADTVKVDPMFQAMKQQMRQPAAAGSRSSRTGIAPRGLTQSSPPMRDGRVLVEAIVRGDGNAALVQQLQAMGATGVKDFGTVVTGWVKVENVDQLSTLSAAVSVRPGWGAVTNSGLVNSQGDAAQQSNLARQNFGVNGAGNKVGIISDSFNLLGTAAQGVANGELPGPGNPNGFTTPVEIVKEGGFVNRTDEGRAMAEIIHDVAPGAALSFYGAESYLDHAIGIRALVNAGATVVVDDIAWFAEPWYQTSQIGRAAVDVGKQNRTVVVTAAANQARQSLEETFVPGPVRQVLSNGTGIGNYSLHQFSNGQFTIPITLPALQAGRLINGTIVLQWEEPFASASTKRGVGSATNLDLFLFAESAGVNAMMLSAANNVGGDAVEIVGPAFTSADPNATITVHLGVGLPAGSAIPTNFKIIVFNPNFALDTSLFNKSTITGHINDESLITSCAVRYDQVGTGFNALVQPDSSVGGFFPTIDDKGKRGRPQNTVKPDVCSPTGANNSFFGLNTDFENDGLPNFFGTSASAPHLAGVVALMKQASGQRIKPSKVKDILIRSAEDMNNPDTPGADPGHDVKTGHGFLRATTAVGDAAR